ncbi:PREDICTED: receptor-like protein 12 [Ipomoea nil]|uniref:receptor-like protein 12 n=1 Tax=Ipomoea nil TaxID=35883 RepID=UPI000900EB36|nr:PREDICTED: receptor-like protein 12 [Ipomoea nil]
MKTPVLECRLFFFISSCLLLQMVAAQAPAQCLSHQKMLLLQFRSSLKFNPIYSTKLARWNHSTHDNCCVWAGVECDTSGHVISLILDSETISDGINSSSALFSLQYLERLNLAFNTFNFTPIPVQIYNLTNLTYLNLSKADFGGQIPSGISRLTRIDLRYCSFSGSIPSTLAQLRNLTYVDFSNNHFTGSIPHSLSSKNLITIDFSFNGLAGPLSSKHFEDLSKIVYINLRSNCISGRIPPSLFSLPSLHFLDLSNNLFDGLVDEYVNVSASQLKSLNLRSNRLNGSFPIYFFEFPKLSVLLLSSNSLSGKIQSSLFLLPSLHILVLSNNSFHGLVDEYVNVSDSQLESLYLSSNRLNGSFPEYFFEFPKLSDLGLSSNSLSGKIQSSLFSLPSLQRLDLSDNSFDGLVDEYVNVSDSQLESLDLSSNRLNGSFPEYLFEFPKLSKLLLSSNSLSGKIQSSLFSLPSLFTLDLSNNSFDSLVDEYVNVSDSQLERLHLRSNHLINWSFLKYFFGFPKLNRLDLSDNGIRGEIPSWIWGVGNGTLYHLNLSCNFLDGLEEPYTIPSSLTVLDLHSNQLRGPIPIAPTPTDGYSYLDYSHNCFNGSIPSGLGSFATNAFFLSLSNNSFTGTIPESICNASSLDILDLSKNKLSGILPSCLFNSFERLRVLDLGKNQIHGNIPDSFTINCALQTLYLSRNSFEGKIPKSLINCSSLEVLDIGNNKMVDTFPCPLKNLSSLRVLVLQSNVFHGDLHCVNANHMWPNLQIIDIASNNFSGNLSPKLLNWKGMTIDEDTAQVGQYIMFFDGRFHIGNAYYQDRLMVTMKGMEMEMVKILRVFASIDFSCNNFHGIIPDSIGVLTTLYVLNLSHNALTGNIPKTIGNLKAIESLDLSANQLNGKIPSELAKLTFLSVLNLSFNRLSGVIPTGNQLNTFEASSYLGNPELCGLPLPKSCKSPKTSNGGRSEIEFDGGPSEIKWEYVTCALGFAVGLGAYLWMLLHNKRCREAYQQLDEVLIRLFGPRQRGRKSPGPRRRVRRNRF